MASGGVAGEARVVVGLDFGTTYSGFAYAHRSNPNEVKKFFAWPDQGANPSYCKTETSLYYQREEGGGDRYDCTEWGWSAHRRHSSEASAAAKAARKRKGSLTPAADLNRSGEYITKFKLHLAGEENVGSSRVGPLTSAPLPPGITAERAITDYLSKISAFILQLLQDKYGKQLTMEEVQWCLTVPAIWNDSAKLKMKTCAEKAGLVAGHHTPPNTVTSRYPLKIVLEPEAAAFYCWNQACYKDLNVQRGHHLLVADIGGGTADIVVHEKANDGSDFSVNEVDASSGGLCGGSYVDQSFFRFIGRHMSFIDERLSDNPWEKMQLLKRWHELKTEFQGTYRSSVTIDLPQGLATAWKKYDDFKDYEPRENYEELQLTNEDMIEIFRPCVDEIIRLIDEKMTAKVKVLMVVGGFSASPYLMKRLKDAFSYRVTTVINPLDPGAAIACGAVLMGLVNYDRAPVQSASPSSSGRFNLGAGAGSYQILSRVAKKTYGIMITLPFQESIHTVTKRWQNEEGILMCNDLFDLYVSKGQRLDAETYVITKEYGMPSAFANAITVYLFSTDAVAPNLPLYTTDDGVTCVGRFTMDVADGKHLGASRKILVTMQFGTSVIEVKGTRLNFGNTSQVESFWVAYD